MAENKIHEFITDGIRLGIDKRKGLYSKSSQNEWRSFIITGLKWLTDEDGSDSILMDRRTTVC